VINGKRPGIEIKTKIDLKIKFMIELFSVCWEQAPGNRPNMKQISAHFKEMMSTEGKNPVITSIIYS